MGKDEETEELIKILRVSKRPFDRLTALSGATSIFDVQRWTFDVRCSVFSMFVFFVKVSKDLA